MFHFEFTLNVLNQRLNLVENPDLITETLKTFINKCNSHNEVKEVCSEEKLQKKNKQKC